MITITEQFARLTAQETELLIKAPVLLSLLAAGGDNEVSEHEKAEVIRQAHLKTYTGLPELNAYYTEVDRQFKRNFDEAIEKYTPFNAERRQALTAEVSRMNDTITQKLDKDAANLLRKSLGDYARHVKYADRDFIGNYLFPFAF